MKPAAVFLQRTSRKGPGSWNRPVFERSPLAQGAPAQKTRGTPASSQATPPHGGQRGHRSSSSSSSAAAAASATMYNSGDNPLSHSADAASPFIANWKADPRRAEPLYRDPFNTSHAGQRRSATTGATGAAGSAGVGGEEQTVRSPHPDRAQTSQANWLGGDPQKSAPEVAAMKRNFGVEDFSMVDRTALSLTALMRMAMDATFKPRNADSRSYGGDGQSKLMEQREELKNMDHRIVPFAHEELMNNYLKNIGQLHGPTGQLCGRDVLQGRLVGLLFFTESERCMEFMRVLKRFHEAHNPDFVVVTVSAAGKEMLDVSRNFGFFHCTHRDGATWVKRDAGLMMRGVTPMPRLVIVNGTTGIEICRSGVTAVLSHPATCFQAWRDGDCGHTFWDYRHSIYI